MRLQYLSVESVPPAAWVWPHFAIREWASKGDGKVVVETEFMDRLERLRAAYGKPMILNSGYRSPEHNVQVAETGPNGPHTTGRAGGVRVSGPDAVHLLQLALGLGFTGIGVQQKGALDSRYLHLDDLAAPAFPR